MLAKQFGGAERHCVDLVAGLTERGHPTTVILQPDAGSSRHFSRCDQQLLRLEVVRVRGNWDWYAKRKVRNLLRRCQPDVVHTHLARASHIAAPQAKREGIPTITNSHNYIALKYYADVDHFVVPTSRQFHYLSDQQIAPSRLHEIPHFSPLAVQDPKGVVDGPLHMVSLGRFVEKKGYDLLLRAFAALVHEGLDARLSLAGDGEQKRTLRDLAETLSIAQHVEFCGWIDNVAEFVRGGDLFILPSRDEPFGIVVLEAMACGIPIVTTNTHGPSEILSSENAYFAASDDFDSLLVAMKSACRDPAARSERARNAAALFTSRYSADVVVPRYISLYEKMCKNAQDTTR
ncbi:MAG: glycosyltransferase [Pseudomonadota bacterium]